MLVIFFLLITAKCWLTAAYNANDFKLELIQTIFRHGDRTPETSEIYPTHPYNASTYEPFGYGQLTNVGKRREYEIGQQLRKRFGYFLGDTYKPSEVYAYSTDFDRTKMSLQLVLAGLYPPTKSLTWNENVHWIPFSTFYNPLELDFLQTAFTCPLYKELQIKALNSPTIRKKLAQYADTIRHILKNAGYSVTAYDKIVGVYDTIECDKNFGLPLPRWLSKKQYNKFQEVVSIVYDTMSFTTAQKKISSGPALKRFLDNIDNQEKKTNQRKIYLYSAHDMNVEPFLEAHGLKYPTLPNFGVAVIVEKLRGPDNGIYIRLSAWLGTDGKFVTYKLNGCDEICPLTKYLEIIEPILPDGDGTECTLENVKESLMYDFANREVPTNLISNRHGIF